jgi:hypothetical protein
MICPRFLALANNFFNSNLSYLAYLLEVITHYETLVLSFGCVSSPFGLCRAQCIDQDKPSCFLKGLDCNQYANCYIIS